LFPGWQAVSDMPCVNFAKELVTAFPNAKVVLTKRDPDSWIKSMNTTIYDILEWRLWPILKYIDPVWQLQKRARKIKPNMN